MSQHLPTAYYVLWISHPVLELSIAALMAKRKLHKKFPIFFIYLLSQLVTFAIVFPLFIKGTYELFFYGYWICAVVSLAAGFKVLQEVFRDVFRPYYALKDLGNVLFKWAGLVMLLVAGVVAASSGASDQGPMVQAVLTVQRCVRLMQFGLILFLVMFAKYLGVSWRQSSFGIALGFGSFASIELMAVALRASGYMGELTLSVILMATYNFTLVIWSAYIWLKEPAREASVLLTSQRWDQSLGDLQQPAAPDSLIPMFEGMVDRAFSRTVEVRSEAKR
jgi:hypothetical protein